MAKYLQKSSTDASVVPNIINNKAVPLPESQNFPVVQATTGDTIHFAQSATVDVGVQAVEAAAAAFTSWKRTPVAERRALLNRAADIMETKVAEAQRREVPETSCDERWPGFDATVAASFIRETAAHAAVAVEGSIPSVERNGYTSLVFKEPVGVILIIPP